MLDFLRNLNWKNYLNNRLITEHQSGFSIIIPNNAPDPVPLFCPVCECSISNVDDINTCQELGCCYHCKEHWYYQNKEAWATGWRPNNINTCNHVKTVIVSK